MSKWARHLTLSDEVFLRGPPHTHRRGPGPLRSGPKPTVCGSATGTHRVHPSGRIAFRLISGLSPQGHPGSDHQSGGGAGSASPQGKHDASPNVASFWLPARRQPIRSECLGLRPALYSRTRRPRPSRDAGQYLRPELVSRACIYKVSGVRRHGQWKEK
jgi:hypothetical protein